MDIHAYTLTIVPARYAMLRDEMCTVIYELAKVDFDEFFQQALPGYVQHVHGLTNEEKYALVGLVPTSSTDQPTFVRCMLCMVNDALYFARMHRAAGQPGHMGL